jgi:hypothetical protein
LDEAVSVFGNTISNELDEIEAKTAKQTKAKRTNHLRKRLGFQAQYRRGTPTSGTTPGR